MTRAKDINSVEFSGKWYILNGELFLECGFWVRGYTPKTGWVRKRKWWVFWLFEVECLEYTGEAEEYKYFESEGFISENNLVDLQRCHYDQ